MTTAPDHHGPLDEMLSEDERDLAARLARIGPFDGPSPALDAKILATAHAAAVTRLPRRRLAWLGVPPAVVTGMGVAAAAVLALGLVWQLRPQPGLVTAHGEADVGEEVILIAEPAGAGPAPAVNPPPPPEESAAAAPARRSPPAMTPAMPPAASRDSAKAIAAPAPTAMADETAALAAQAASAAEQEREADSVARDASAESGFVAEPPAAAAARRGHATYTTAARARAEQRERVARNAAPAAPPPPAPVAEAAPASAAATAEAPTLDRIEVTGSRIGQGADGDWSQVPVSDDTRLAAAEWLERIRARRDGDDADSARASLRLFQREHPRVRLPDDLRELLADPER